MHFLANWREICFNFLLETLFEALKKIKRAAILFFSLHPIRKTFFKKKSEVLTFPLFLKRQYCKDLHTKALEYLYCSTSGNYLTRESIRFSQLPQAWHK